MALKLPGVELEAGTRRHYPHGPLASHIIGGMNLDRRYPGRHRIPLRCPPQGQEGEQINYRVRGGRGYQSRVIKPPVPGRDIFLTIDATIQYIAEKELAKAVAEHRGEMGNGHRHGPAEGEILAMANRPAYDVNDFPVLPERPG